MSETSTPTMSAAAQSAMNTLQRIAPGRLAIHGRNHRIPHIVDAFVIHEDKPVAVVSIISGSLAESVSLAAAFAPDLIAWTGPAASDKTDAAMQYMSVLAQRGDDRTWQSTVAFRRDEGQRKLSMAPRSVPVSQAPQAAASALLGAFKVAADHTGAIQTVHETNGRVGMLLYGEHLAALLIGEVFHQRAGWSKLADGSVMNSAGTAQRQRSMLRSLSVYTSVQAFRDEIETGSSTSIRLMGANDR